MQKFANRAQGAKITLSMDMVNLVPAGQVIIGGEVTIALYEGSEASDPNPAAVLINDPQVEGTKILQMVGGGVVKATYVLSFKATYQDETYDIEQATQTIGKYVP